MWHLQLSWYRWLRFRRRVMSLVNSYILQEKTVRSLEKEVTVSSEMSAATVFKVKIKVTLIQALRLCTGRTAHRESRGIALPFNDHGTRRGWGVSVTPRPLFTPGKTRYPLYRRLGRPQGRSGQVQKISPATGFDPQTVKPVASHYTKYTTRPTTTVFTDRQQSHGSEELYLQSWSICCW